MPAIQWRFPEFASLSKGRTDRIIAGQNHKPVAERNGAVRMILSCHDSVDWPSARSVTMDLKLTLIRVRGTGGRNPFRIYRRQRLLTGKGHPSASSGKAARLATAERLEAAWSFGHGMALSVCRGASALSPREARVGREPERGESLNNQMPGYDTQQ